ncbi:MAG: PhnD/SsuA/transferrin family substrate-binding protein [Magnetococcales bacterium]|nr:PhnD/SsuA/transferrin family substrate-binding protein [Magnetococcales bacterium]
MMLKFGIYTSEKASTMVQQFRPVLDALEQGMEQRLGQPVTITTIVSPTYEDGRKKLTTGQVDLARMGPASYVLAKLENHDLSLLVFENDGGDKWLDGVIAVRKDSSIQQISDLRGKSFAFGDESSTIGRYLAQYAMMENGVLARDLSQYTYLGRHDLVGQAVLHETYDAGAMKEDVYNKLVAAGKPLRAIARLPNITGPWAARADMDPIVRQAIIDSLLELKDPKVLNTMRKNGFLPGTDDDLVHVRRTIENNARFFLP